MRTLVRAPADVPGLRLVRVVPVLHVRNPAASAQITRSALHGHARAGTRGLGPNGHSSTKTALVCKWGCLIQAAPLTHPRCTSFFQGSCTHVRRNTVTSQLPHKSCPGKDVASRAAPGMLRIALCITVQCALMSCKQALRPPADDPSHRHGSVRSGPHPPVAKRVRDGGVVVDEVQRQAAARQPRAAKRERRPRLLLEAQHAHVEAARAVPNCTNTCVCPPMLQWQIIGCSCQENPRMRM